MTTLRLVSFALCPYVQRAAIVLAEKHVAFERVDIDLADKPDWFQAISPLGKVPLLQVGDAVLFESAAIVEYLDETFAPPMHPTDRMSRARHRGWIEFASTVLNDIARFYNASDDDALAAAWRQLAERFDWLERHFGDGPYFDGETFRLVDAAWAPVFRYLDAFERIDDLTRLHLGPKVARYRKALAERPSVRTAVVADFADRLLAFLASRGSALSRRVARAA